jgi:multiple sugar transport system substrate-binding protein
MKLSRTFTAGAVSLAALLAGGTAFADCGLQGAGNVAILSNDFEALRIVNGVAMSCATAEVTVTANATAEHKNLQGPALTATRPNTPSPWSPTTRSCRCSTTT